MGGTKIILISLRRPQTLLQRLQQGLGLPPGKAKKKLLNACRLIREKKLK